MEEKKEKNNKYLLVEAASLPFPGLLFSLAAGFLGPSTAFSLVVSRLAGGSGFAAGC